LFVFYLQFFAKPVAGHLYTFEGDIKQRGNFFRRDIHAYVCRQLEVGSGQAGEAVAQVYQVIIVGVVETHLEDFPFFFRVFIYFHYGF